MSKLLKTFFKVQCRRKGERVWTDSFNIHGQYTRASLAEKRILRWGSPSYAYRIVKFPAPEVIQTFKAKKR